VAADPVLAATPEVSGADIAETTLHRLRRRQAHARQVRSSSAGPADPGSQLALFTAWDYHAFVTDRTLPLAEVEADHRRHASSSRPSPSSRAPAWPICHPASSWPTPPGSP
jgi:hypothetical protein